MEIRMGSLVRDAREATGTAIVIDVFRAFTTAAIAFDRGATQITLVAEAEDALELHRGGVGDLLMGRWTATAGIRPRHSPFEISRLTVERQEPVQSPGGTWRRGAADSAQTLPRSFRRGSGTVDSNSQPGRPAWYHVAMGDQGKSRSLGSRPASTSQHNGGRKPEIRTLGQALVLQGGPRVFSSEQPQSTPGRRSGSSDATHSRCESRAEGEVAVARRKPVAPRCPRLTSRNQALGSGSRASLRATKHGAKSDTRRCTCVDPS